MALPTSRDITVSPVSSVPSALANKLQDMIIGAKFPSTDFPFPAGAWRQQAAAGILGDGQWTFSGFDVVDTGCRFMVGTLISSIKFAYNRGNAGTINLRLKKRNLVTGAAVVVVSSVAIVAGTGWTTSVLAPAYTTEADFAVWLEADCSNAANIFGGAIVTASRL